MKTYDPAQVIVKWGDVEIRFADGKVQLEMIQIDAEGNPVVPEVRATLTTTSSMKF